MVCRGNLPDDLISRLNRRTTGSQRVVGYRPTILFLPDGLAGLKDTIRCPLVRKSIVGRDGLAPLPADTLGTGLKMRGIAPTTSPLPRPVHARSVEPLLQRPHREKASPD